MVAGTTGRVTASVSGWWFSPRHGWESRPHAFARHPLPSGVTPDVAVRVSGAASVAWAGNDGRIVVGNRGTDGRWTGPQVIATERPRTVVRTAIAFDPSGRALVAWTRNRDRRVVTRTRLTSFRWTPRAPFVVSRVPAFEVDFSLGVNARGTAAVMAVVQRLRTPSTGVPFERTVTGLVARPGRAYLPTSTTVVQPTRDGMSEARGPVSVSDGNTFVTAWEDLSGSNAPATLRAACGRVPLR